MTRALVTQMLNALEYHQSQTRPIHNTELAIEAAREYLATEPIPVQSPARKEFISRLREWDNVTLETSRLYMQKAANMLQADAQEIAVMEHQVEILTDELSRCEKQANRVPMAGEEIEKIADGCRAGAGSVWPHAFARAIEAHRDTPPAQKPTDWSAA